MIRYTLHNTELFTIVTAYCMNLAMHTKNSDKFRDQVQWKHGKRQISDLCDMMTQPSLYFTCAFGCIFSMMKESLGVRMCLWMDHSSRIRWRNVFSWDMAGCNTSTQTNHNPQYRIKPSCCIHHGKNEAGLLRECYHDNHLPGFHDNHLPWI